MQSIKTLCEAATWLDCESSSLPRLYRAPKRFGIFHRAHVEVAGPAIYWLGGLCGTAITYARGKVTRVAIVPIGRSEPSNQFATVASVVERSLGVSPASAGDGLLVYAVRDGKVVVCESKIPPRISITLKISQQDR